MPTAFITGASGVIGHGIAEIFAQKGYDLALHYGRHREPAEALAEKLKTYGHRVFLVQGDISKVEDIERMFAEVEEHLGGLDCMVNNAGVTVIFPLLEATEAQFDRVVDTDLKGTFFCTKMAALNMIKYGKKGAVINISSNHDKGVWINFAAYASVKAGLDKFAMNAAVELAPHGIRVVSVAPGYTGPDDCNDTHEVFGMSDHRYYDGVTSCIPLKRFCTASEIGKLVAFLASEDAAYITGTTVTADGGSLLPALSGKWKLFEGEDPLEPGLDEWIGHGLNGTRKEKKDKQV